MRQVVLTGRPSLGRTFLPTAMLCIAAPTLAGEPNPQGQLSQTEQRQYLPVLLQKALLENETETGRSLKDWTKQVKFLRDGGAIDTAFLEEFEQEVLQSRIRAVQFETKYRNALDQFNLLCDATAERLKKLEESAILPLLRHFRQFEAIRKEADAISQTLARNGVSKDAPKLRAVIRKALTGAELLKDTEFGKQVTTDLAKWEKFKNLEKPLETHISERLKLQQLRQELQIMFKPFPPAKAQRLKEAEFQIDLGSFERSLRAYEGEPWRKEKSETKRTIHHFQVFSQVEMAFGKLLNWAVLERVAHSEKTWPELAPVKLKGVDVLTCDLQKAEKVVESLCKKPDSAVTGKATMRELRALAETNQLQQRLYKLRLMRVWTASDDFLGPPDLGPSFDVTFQPPSRAQTLLAALKSFHEVRSQLIRTWINYQITRLDLYNVLGK